MCIRDSLKPISDITKLTSEIQPNSTYRINVDTAKYELKELVITINDMLDRLNAAHVKRRKFVSDVSHELRTPISVITGYANMLKRWAKDDEAVFDESVDAIIEESENMKYLVENLLFLARCDNDQLTYDKEPFDISSLIEDIYKDAKMVDNNKHDLSGDITQGVIINGDRNRLKQAMREFVQNAIKYTPPTGKIKISLQKEDNKAIINITDTGIGISKKDMGHIFTRFYRGDISRNRDNGGYGLGMSIAREIVSSHDGKIKIKSKEGEGTSVIVTFDLA
jgi:signal transduction histidine kinase